MISQRRITEKERQQYAKFTEKHTGRFWGHDSTITPVLINTVFGDGKKLLYFSAFATRPNYYLVLVDSSYDDEAPDNMEKLFGDLQSDPILTAIEEEFGCYDDNMGTPEDYCGDLYWQKLRPWPALDESCGYCWGLHYAADWR